MLLFSFPFFCYNQNKGKNMPHLNEQITAQAIITNSNNVDPYIKKMNLKNS